MKTIFLIHIELKHSPVIKYFVTTNSDDSKDKIFPDNLKFTRNVHRTIYTFSTTHHISDVKTQIKLFGIFAVINTRMFIPKHQTEPIT